jgi:predicted DNA-binding WGR domain protein
MDRTYLEFSDGVSHKFYEVTVEGETLTVRYGRIGDAGQINTRTFETPQKAQAEAQKKLADKRKDGYAEAVQGEREKIAQPKAARVPKLQIVGFAEVTEPITEAITKFGGQPVWLEEPRWPLSTETNAQLPFLCQIRLEPEIFGNIATRMAYIFFGHSYGEGKGFTDGESAVVLQPSNVLWRVDWGDALNSNTHVVSAVGPTTIRKTLNFMGWHGKTTEFLASLRPGHDPIGVSAEDWETWTEQRQDAYINAVQGHKIGGTADPAWHEFQLEDGIEDWNLLLQLEPCSEQVEGFEVSFGDGGMGWWWISKDGTRLDYSFYCH